MMNGGGLYPKFPRDVNRVFRLASSLISDCIGHGPLLIIG